MRIKRTILIGTTLFIVFGAGAVFASAFADEAERYFDRSCNRRRVTGATAALCYLRDRIEETQGIPGPPGPKGEKGDKGDPGAPGATGISNCVIRSFAQDPEILTDCYSDNHPFDRQATCSTTVLCNAGELATGGSCFYEPDYEATRVTSTGSFVYDIRNPQSFSSMPVTSSGGIPIGWKCFAPDMFYFESEPKLAHGNGKLFDYQLIVSPTANVVCCEKTE